MQENVNKQEKECLELIMTRVISLSCRFHLQVKQTYLQRKQTPNSTDLSKDEIDPQPSTSAGIVGDTVLISKVKHVSIRAQFDILKQAADTSGLSSKGMSKSNIHRIGRKVIQETAEEAREALRAKAGLNMILHYEGKLVKE